MSIGARVNAAVAKMAAGEFEQALYQICSAIDATSTKETGREGRRSYKHFLHDNLALITLSGFGVRVLNLNIEFDHARIDMHAEGLCTFQDIIYHAVRCGLFHDAGLPPDPRAEAGDRRRAVARG